jgi:hypothetical protein
MLLLSNLKQAMDDLPPDVVFMLFVKGGREEYVGTTCDIVLGAEVFLCEACQVQPSYCLPKRTVLHTTRAGCDVEE